MTKQGLKQTLRQRIISERKQLPVELRLQFSTEIIRRIETLPDYQTARVVMGYMNFGAEFESDLWVRQALADGKQVLLPKVNRTTRELDVYHVTDLQQQLAPGLWNIREPMPDLCDRMISLKEVDLILLPGVAFGREGARLGYGGGFYDKLLERLENECGSNHGVALVAGAFSLQLVEEIPQEPTDRRIQWLLTEHEAIDCSKIVQS